MDGVPYNRFYNAEMARDMRKIKKPFPFTVDIVENLNCLSLVIYESEITKFNDVERLKVIQYLYDVEALFNSFGVEVAIEGVAGGPQPF
jgi:hypothetical protein